MSGHRGSIVIVGAGQAALQAAASLREQGHAGPLRMIGDEEGLPYSRPPLCKAWLAGNGDAGELRLEEKDWFAAMDVDLLEGERVVSIDRAARSLKLASGRAFGYDHLILATGARNRVPSFARTPLEGVVSLRTLADAAALKARLAVARRLVVIGAGFLGLEVASLAAACGREVHVVESLERAMKRALSKTMSAHATAHLERSGVRFTFDARVTRLHGAAGRVEAVELADGTRLPSDLVLVATGVEPNCVLGLECKLPVFNGFVVDARLRTADPAISAIGDCAAFPYAFDGGDLIRLESVQNAVDQARHVARTVLGAPDCYDTTPIFWSELAGARLQIAGIARRLDGSVVRRDPLSGGFSVFRYRHDRLTGVESFNCPADHMLARRMLQRRVSPTREQAADPSCDLKALLAARMA
ncbi:NAD(P)/FAD-dependent oxidoreductase [Paraburkholderia nodosa]|uniref:NAD(P)/FAD-dependent oxidoreductase n=1 Tax=Paraburkholderia nodosa TaxID=392320 RepID=UPI0004870930|nr:FAD-dependent oxidoreductase [Paraburkholderia nodosa]